jgi:SNF2 family DNA or RNA helicase
MSLLVDVIANKIELKASARSLKPYHLLQLKYWDFLEEKSTFTSQFNRTKFLQVVDYLQFENIAHKFSPISKQIIDSEKNRIKTFNQIKQRALIFKEKKNSVEFAEFAKQVQKNLKRTLKKHQLRAAYHLLLIGNGANFSVPGSGKTSVVLSVYEYLKKLGKVNMLFVVGPPSCFSPWLSEFETTLGRKAKFKILAGGNRHRRKAGYYTSAEKLPELCLSSFQTLLNDQSEITYMLSHKNVMPFFVIDEAHYVKQPQGNWAKSVLNIADLAKFRCVLTGTPMPRGYTDLFNLFDFLWLSDSPINWEAKGRIEKYQRDENERAAKEELKSLIGPFFYRVPKSELGLTKPVLNPPIVIKMNNYERQIYDAIFHKIRSYPSPEYLKNIDAITRLQKGRIIRLRQCISYPKLLFTAIEGYNENLVDSELAKTIANYDKLEKPAKLIQLVGMVKKMSKDGLKILIWSNFVGSIELIKKSLSEEGLKCEKITGSVPTQSENFADQGTREKIISRFLDLKSGLNILIANPAACAESISLHKSCQHAIYYDLSYNCAQYLQSLDRIHRVGGSEEKKSYYYFLQYANSLDQDIKRNIEDKTRKMISIIEDGLNVCSMDMFGDSGDEDAYTRLFK